MCMLLCTSQIISLSSMAFLCPLLLISKPFCFLYLVLTNFLQNVFHPSSSRMATMAFQVDTFDVESAEHEIIVVDNGTAVDPSPSNSNGHAFNTQQLAARARPTLVVGGRRRCSRTRSQSPHHIPLSRSRSPMLASIPDGSFLTLLLDPSASEVRLFLSYVQRHLQEDSTPRLDTPLAQLWSLFTLPHCSKVLPITHVFYEIFTAEFAELKGPAWVKATAYALLFLAILLMLLGMACENNRFTIHRFIYWFSVALTIVALVGSGFSDLVAQITHSPDSEH